MLNILVKIPGNQMDQNFPVRNFRILVFLERFLFNQKFQLVLSEISGGQKNSIFHSFWKTGQPR